MDIRLVHTPEGVRDIYGTECTDRISIEDKIRAKFKSYGFRDIETPTFEFFDVFAKEISATSAKELYKFFDKEGNTLVLRPDFTPSMARCVSKYFLEKDTPVRICYKGNTFLNTSNLQGKLKESTEMGVELMNDDSVYADAEMIALMIESLLTSGLTDFQISVGNAEYFKGICEEAGIEDEFEADIREQLAARNYFAAENIMNEKNIDEKYIRMITKVSEFMGSEDALETAASQVNNKKSLEAIDRLKAVYKTLTSYGLEKYVSFDLGLISNNNYYTGVIFNAYTYGVGDAIAKGGRYDNLMDKFGDPAPAIGFMIVVDDLMAALYRQNVELEHEAAPEVVYYDNDNYLEALQKVQDMRAKGINVVLTARQ